MGTRTLALVLLLYLRVSMAFGQAATDATIETKRITDAVSVHVGSDDSRNDTFATSLRTAIT
jgi:hypothetical protein